MDGVIMTSPGNSTRLKSRLRNAASNFLARNSRARQINNKNHAINHRNNRNVSRSHTLRHTKQINNYNQNINANNDGSCVNNNEDTSTFKNINNLNGEGSFTREVYSAISSRLGQALHIPEDSVQALFNDMHLYPSKTQVSEMLQCARQCGRRNGTSTFLTFGEFCIFAREMQNPKSLRKPAQKTKKRENTTKCEVFLGGSCNPTTWRTDTAIPELQKHGISYYNPQVSMWAPELVAQEHDAKQSASVLLYVVDSQTRSVGGMIEVAYLVAAGRCVVLVAFPYRLGQSIMGEPISTREYMDLGNGQISLLALVKSQGIKVHSNLTSALQFTANLLRNSSNINGITAEEQITYKLKKLREAFDHFDVNHSGELLLHQVLDAYYMLTNKSLDIMALYSYLSTSNTSNPSQTRITFEQFCALVAEFSVKDGCDNYMKDGRLSDPLYWTSALLKTRHLLRFYIIQPITNIIEWVSQPLQRQCSRNNNSHCDEINKHANCTTSETVCNYVNGDSYLADVYLGGSCKTRSNWREHIIPLIKKHGLTYYNPAIREMDYYDSEHNINSTFYNSLFYYSDNNTDFDNSVCENKVLHWKRAIDKSRVLMFVVTNDTRSLTTMILAAHYIGMNRSVVLCIEQLYEEFEIANEKLTKQAIKDYNRGRVYLSDLAKRKHVPVFENITEAVQCAIEKCQLR